MSKTAILNFNKMNEMRQKANFKKALLGVLLMGASASSFAQANGIDAGASELATYIDPVANLIIIIGAIVGLVGGVRVFIKWNNGESDVNKAIMSWFGSCIFLVLVGVIVRSFFGV